MCVQWNIHYTSDNAASLVSLVAEPDNIECEDQSPRESGTAMAEPAVVVALGLREPFSEWLFMRDISGLIPGCRDSLCLLTATRD